MGGRLLQCVTGGFMPAQPGTEMMRALLGNSRCTHEGCRAGSALVAFRHCPGLRSGERAVFFGEYPGVAALVAPSAGFPIRAEFYRAIVRNGAGCDLAADHEGAFEIENWARGDGVLAGDDDIERSSQHELRRVQFLAHNHAAIGSIKSIRRCRMGHWNDNDNRQTYGLNQSPQHERLLCLSSLCYPSGCFTCSGCCCSSTWSCLRNESPVCRARGHPRLTRTSV